MERNLAIFDLDNTILNGDSDYSWINFLIEQGYVNKTEYENKNKYFYDQYYQGKLDYDEWAEFALSTIKGKKPEDMESLLSKFIFTSLSNLNINHFCFWPLNCFLRK